jgi:hypothetical protein
MQRAARQRLKSAFRENSRSYAKTARSFGVGEDGKPVVSRGTVYAILEYGKRVSKQIADRMGIVVAPRKRRPNYRLREYYLRKWIRRNHG